MDLLVADPFVNCVALQRALGAPWTVVTPEQQRDPNLVRAVVTESAGFAAARAEQYPNLGVVVTASTGYEGLDVAGLAARGIESFHAMDYCTEEVSDHALAAGLGLLRDLPRYALQHSLGRWDDGGAVQLHRFSASTVGVVGLGRIGAATIRKFRALGMRVLAAHGDGRAPAPGAQREGAPVVPLADLLGLAHLVVLTGAAVPGRPPVIDAARLSLMPEHAALVNVGRAALCDLDAVAAALTAGEIRSAWFDVWAQEPPLDEDSRAHTPGLFLSPHTGWASQESEQQLWETVAACVRTVTGAPPPYPPLSASSQGTSPRNLTR